jgi:hypothetical protein
MFFDLAGNVPPCGIKILNDDIEFGTKYELPVIDLLANHFGENIAKTTDRYAAYDAFSTTTKYEIKSRRNKYAAYPTTIVAVNKTRTEGRLVFVFHYTDGLYYIEYDPVKFSKYEVRNVSAIRSFGKRTETPHFFIPIGDLTHINI